MKITSLELHPEGSSDVAVLSFRDPQGLNQYNVKDIVGLEADSIVSRYYGASGNSKFYNQSLEKRDVIIRIELNPNFTDLESYSDLRDALYKMIASSRTGKIQIQFKNGAVVTAAISGFVTKLEAPKFEKLQEIQITVNCDDPMLKALTPVAVVVAGLNPASTHILDNKSTAPHGFSFNLAITANIASLIINDPTNPIWSFGIVPVGGFLNGDVLHFSSEYTNKYLYLTRGVATIYLADVITPGSVWPILFPNDNVFSITHPINVVWNTISYYPTYWGV